MIADKIKLLREQANMTQSELAKKLGLTRSGVNAWEMGISVPSTQSIIDLSQLFGVSSDFLLGIDEQASVSIKGLTEKEASIIVSLIECLREGHSEEE